MGIQDRHVRVRMKDKYGKFREAWITRDTVSLVKKKKETVFKFKRLGTHGASVEYKESRKKLKQGVRSAKRGHEKPLVSRKKEHPKDFTHI